MNNLIERQDSTIHKTFRDRIAFDHECAIYRMLAGSGLAPALLEQRNLTLVLPYIEAPSLAAVLNEPADPGRMAEILFIWQTGFLDRCHAQSGQWIILDDLNPRNLLVTDSGIIGIDFEAWHAGSLTESCAALPAMIRMMTLPEATKTALAGQLETRLAGYYGIPEDQLFRQVQTCCSAISHRRRIMPVLRQSACAVLTGGRSSRMGTDKASLLLGGYTFLEHILHTVQIFDRISLSTAQPTEQSLYPEICDLIPAAGPAGALHAILSAAETEHVMIVPCDTPLLSRKTILAMYEDLDEDTDAVVLRCGSRDYPVIGIYRHTVLPVLEQMLREKDYRMKDLLSRIRTRYHVSENEKEIFNVNTPEDLQTIRMMYESGQ